MLFTPVILAVGLAAAMGVSRLYVNVVQETRCLDYAQEKELPNLEFLEFTGVVIATNRFKGHVCNFTDTRTGFPVALVFDEEDVPYGADTLQVMSMVVPFLCVGMMGTAILELALAKIGVKDKTPSTDSPGS